MVVGKGLIASYFLSYQKRDDILIFASGVSNSQNREIEVFKREERLLRDMIYQYPRKKIVYFSSCDIRCSDKTNSSLYFEHKQNMEKIIEKQAKNFYIFRLPQVLGTSKNRQTLINYFIDAISNEQSFDIYAGTKKSLIGIDDAFVIIDYIILHSLYENQTIDIVNPNMISVEEIIVILENYLGKKAHYKKRDIDKTCEYDTSIVNKIIPQLNIEFNKDYLKRKLYKFY